MCTITNLVCARFDLVCLRDWSRLGQIGAGDGFGEISLLAGEPKHSKTVPAPPPPKPPPVRIESRLSAWLTTTASTLARQAFAVPRCRCALTPSLRLAWQVTCASEQCEVVALAKRDFLRLVEKSSAVRRSFEALGKSRIEHNEVQATSFKTKADGKFES